MVSTANMALRLLLLTLVLPCSVVVAQEPIVLRGLLVVPIDRIEIPARITGILHALEVREGASVDTDQLLAKLDDAQAKLAAEAASNRYEIAAQVAASDHDVLLAEKTLAREKQTAVSQQLTSEIAARKSKNDVRVLAAEKAEAVAGNELRRAGDARRKFSDSVSQSELEGLNLAYQRAQLETKQAAFELELDSLLEKSAVASLAEHKLAIEQAALTVEQAVAEKAVATLQTQSAAIDLELAQLLLSHHQVRSPIPGVITKVYRRPGQWLQAGEPVLEVLRLDRLRAEGYVSDDIAQKLRRRKTVIVKPENSEMPTANGQITFVNWEVDAVKGDVKYWVEFDNPDRAFLPGKVIQIVVQP